MLTRVLAHASRVGVGLRGISSSSASLARVLCADNVSATCAQILEDAGHRVTQTGPLSAKELEEQLRAYDVLVVRSGTTVTASALATAPNLKIIGRAGVGVDNIDIPAATRQGCIVMNTPMGNTRAAAELTLSLMANMLRQVPPAYTSMRAGKWDRKTFMGHEMKGRTLGLIGVGAIGRHVARWASEFGMKVVGFDPALTADKATELGIEAARSLDALYARADVISLHVPGGPSTKGMINAKAIAAMKPGAFVVNVARGTVLDIPAVLAALESGKLAGVAVDVYPEEPPKDETVKKLIQHPRVVCTPHLGASTEEAQVAVAEDVARQIVDALAGTRFEGIVNVPHVGLTRDPVASPYLALADTLGSFVGQTVADPATAREVEVFFRGKAMESDPRYKPALIGAMLRGFLPQIRPDLSVRGVSLLSAPSVAQELGVTVRAQKAADAERDGVAIGCEEYQNLVVVRTRSKGGQINSVAGSLIEGEGRIVAIDEWRGLRSFRPSGTVLLCNNTDRPGQLAKISSVLADANINVASMGVTRQGIDMPALTILTVDERIPRSVKSRIESLPGFTSVRTATFGAE